MRGLADEMRRTVTGPAPDLDRFTALLHEGWELSGRLGSESASNVSDAGTRCRFVAASREKPLSAGGGGVLLLMAPPERYTQVWQTLSHPNELPLRIAWLGS